MCPRALSQTQAQSRALPWWSPQSGKKKEKEKEMTERTMNIYRHKQSPHKGHRAPPSAQRASPGLNGALDEAWKGWRLEDRCRTGGQQLLTIYSIVAKQMPLMTTLHQLQPKSSLLALVDNFQMFGCFFPPFNFHFSLPCLSSILQ